MIKLIKNNKFVYLTTNSTVKNSYVKTNGLKVCLQYFYKKIKRINSIPLIIKDIKNNKINKDFLMFLEISKNYRIIKNKNKFIIL